tara:strand:- start:173 stop:643 length:471 start_codon:yes stop_codon:yes gene_type:complete
MTEPRRYTLDNGNYKENMMLTRFDIIPISNDLVAGHMDKLDSTTVFFCVATTEDGAIPIAPSVSEFEYGNNYNLRLSDSRQIAWGVMSPAYAYVYSLIDPDHIIPEDVYINAWSLASDGSINPPAFPVGFMLKMELKKNTGAEGLVYRAKDSERES